MRNALILLLISIFLVGCQTKVIVEEELKEGEEMNVEDIRKLGRKGIIDLAVESIKQSPTIDASTFDIKNFNRIKVMASNKSVYVTFNMTILYVPINSAAHYGVYVNLIDNLMSFSRVANPKDYKEDIKTKLKFFTPAEESEKAIAFVLDAIRKNDRSESEFTIYEKPDYYEIEIVEEEVEGGYKIDKITGKIYDVYHDHLVPRPREKDKEKFEEIKD